MTVLLAEVSADGAAAAYVLSVLSFLVPQMKTLTVPDTSDAQIYLQLAQRTVFSALLTRFVVPSKAPPSGVAWPLAGFGSVQVDTQAVQLLFNCYAAVRTGGDEAVDAYIGTISAPVCLVLAEYLHGGRAVDGKEASALNACCGTAFNALAQAHPEPFKTAIASPAMSDTFGPQRFNNMSLRSVMQMSMMTAMQQQQQGQNGGRVGAGSGAAGGGGAPAIKKLDMSKYKK